MSLPFQYLIKSVHWGSRWEHVTLKCQFVCWAELPRTSVPTWIPLPSCVRAWVEYCTTCDAQTWIEIHLAHLNLADSDFWCKMFMLYHDSLSIRWDWIILTPEFLIAFLYACVLSRNSAPFKPGQVQIFWKDLRNRRIWSRTATLTKARGKKNPVA